MQQAIIEVSDLIYKKKNDYYNALPRKLSDPTTISKIYWFILKTFYNTKKVPIIPPILLENKLESDFFKKANYFNKFFASKCTPLNNSSSLPSSLDFETEARLTSINFSANDILKIIRSLDINKAHGHDDISVRMVKICDDAIKKPLLIIYKNCIKKGIYPNTRKKSSIVPVHKKEDKQIVNNYRLVSLLPIFGKIFDKILFNSIFGYPEENCLLCDNQSGFPPSDSCEYQLLSIVHDIYASFDCNPPKDVIGILPDLSKAFDRVWHEGLIYRMKCIGVTGMPLKLLLNVPQNRHQQVLLNGQCSSWAPVFASVPQGSVLAHLFFLIYINELTKDISSTNSLLMIPPFFLLQMILMFLNMS